MKESMNEQQNRPTRRTRWVAVRNAALLAITFMGMGGLLFPSTGLAQLEPRGTGGAGVVFEPYSFSDADAAGMKSLMLTTVLVSANAALGRTVSLGVAGYYATGSVERPDGSKATLSGLTDTRLVVTVPLGEWFTLSGIGVLPTGKNSLTAEELEVAGRIAADLLPFRISHWGAGGGVGANVAFARRMGSVGLGLSAGYVFAGEFDPLAADQVSYRPGDLMQVRAAIDGELGRGSKATLQVGLDLYGNDQIEQANAYSTGNRTQVMGSYAWPVSRRSQGLAYVGWLHRGSSASSSELLPLPAQDLALLGLGFRAPLGQGTIVPDLDVRLFRRDDGVGQGAYAGLGAALEWPLGATTIVPALKARFGTLDVSGNESTSFYGAEARFAVRFGGGS